MSFINNCKQLLEFGPKVNYTKLVKQGVVIVDVHSKSEYAGGHIQSSVNIPIDQLSTSLSQLKDKHKPILTCCASARSILNAKGYRQVYNGGSWNNLQNKIG